MSRSSIGLALLATAAVSLAGCAEPSTSYSISQEHSTPAATSWQDAAANMWQEVSQRLEAGGFHETQISIEPPGQQTAFTQALDNFLFTEAVDHGVAVAQGADFTVTYDTQIVHHADSQDVAAPVLTPDVVNASDVQSGGTDEVILNVSVTDGNSVRIRESRVFNVPDGDIGLYQDQHGDVTAKALENKPVVASNWYSDNPHDVLPIAMHEDNQFAIMVDRINGPVHDVNAATDVAGKHCSTLGMSQAKYISQGYPTNDRNQIRVVYECM
jgi:hypothetical protein